MAVEIERKFLVVSDAWKQSATNAVFIRQGYLCRSGDIVTRVRIAGQDAFLTIKSGGAGLVRLEYEYAIPHADAEKLLQLCPAPLIEKTRHKVSHAGRIWDVDVFEGARAGLVLAECELDDANTQLDAPDWAGAEVTDDPNYRNEAL
jgi:adenylate cyclase